MLAMHMFFMAPQQTLGLSTYDTYTLTTSVTTVVGAHKVLRGGDMSMWDTVTNLPVLVDQTTVGVNE